jgi:hypothetical protein
VCLLLAGVLLGALLVSDISANLGERWQYSMANVVMLRVLPHADVKADFEKLGMPHVSDALKPQSRRAYADPRLASLREWVNTRGKAAYERYLLSHPRFFVLAPASHAHVLLGHSLLSYRAEGFEPHEPAAVEFLWASQTWGPRAVVIAALSLALLVWRRTRRSPFVWFGVVLAALAYPHLTVVYHGDPLEPWRHCLLVNVQLDLALVLLLTALVDARRSPACRAE